MRSTMPDLPLLVRELLRHGGTVHAAGQVTDLVTDHTGPRPRRRGYSDVYAEAARLAHALHSLGVDGDQRVGTLLWNGGEHLAAYLGVPAMGAVLHTLNTRLSVEQLAYVITHAEDEVVLVDESLVTLLEQVLPRTQCVRHVIVVGADAPRHVDTPDGVAVHDYAQLLDGRRDEYSWPDLDDRVAASVCYTSGTTGMPKGVAYSHRSTFLHAMSICSGNAFAFTDLDRVLPLVPMFHANAWGWPYAAWIAGSHILLSGRSMTGTAVADFIAETHPSAIAAVPTIVHDLLRIGRTDRLHLDHVRLLGTGGTTLPRAIAEELRDTYGIEAAQGWGMTETSPLATWSRPPAHATGDPLDWQLKAGRILFGVQARVVDENGTVLPSDGAHTGEIELRGAWITSSYVGEDGTDRFDDDWLRTGDLGHIGEGWLTILDRAKDGIKSGGEWISTPQLEDAVRGSGLVADALAVGIPDPRWDERPLVCVVAPGNEPIDFRALRDYLFSTVPRWWVPEHWVQLAELPRTTVGKFDKKLVRQLHTDGALDVQLVPLRDRPLPPTTA